MSSPNMTASWYNSYGPASEVLQVGPAPIPQPEAGEVRVKVHVSAVNPGDTKARRGMRGRLPFDWVVPHSAGAGVVESVGSGVTTDLVGQRVWIHGAGYGRRWGTGAEYTVVPTDLIAPLPDSVSFREGACLGIPAMTAHRCLFADGPIRATTVLVVGGSGSVGTSAIQLADWGEASVVAITGAAHQQSVASLGVESVFDRDAPDLVSALHDQVGDRSVDRIVAADFDLALRIAPQLLAPLGTIATFAVPSSGTPELPFRTLMLRNTTIRMVYLFGVPIAAKRHAMIDIGSMLAERDFSCPIIGVYSLQNIVEAHEAIERPDTRGLALIEMAV